MTTKGVVLLVYSNTNKRAAAARCRTKKKVWTSNLEKKAEELQTANARLQVGRGALNNSLFYLIRRVHYFMSVHAVAMVTEWGHDPEIRGHSTQVTAAGTQGLSRNTRTTKVWTTGFSLRSVVVFVFFVPFCCRWIKHANYDAMKTILTCLSNQKKPVTSFLAQVTNIKALKVTVYSDSKCFKEEESVLAKHALSGL